jgi:hypothetical protein
MSFLLVTAAALLAPGTPDMAVVDGGGRAGCASMPMGGTGSATGNNGTLTITGTEGKRTVTLGKRHALLGGDVLAATVRDACHAARTDYFLLAVTSADAACPVRYQVVEARGPAPLRFSPRFGNCADTASASLAPGGLTVSMPGGAYRYAAGRIAPVVAPPPVPPVVAVAAPTRRGDVATWSSPSACAAIARAEPVAAEAYLSRLRADWPRDWQTRGRLADQPFSTATLRTVVTDLSCLSALPGGEAVVAETSRALFASNRHGKAAFDQLDEVARGRDIDPAIRAAARTFHAQMRYTVGEVRLH